MLFYSYIIFAQKMNCDEIIFFLNQKETKITNLNLHDPDYIPLHYLVSLDIIKDLKRFSKEVIAHYTECNAITFSELINRYDTLHNSILQKHDSLVWLNKNVYFIFYEKALYEYQLNNEEDGTYFLNRSLQYNSIFPNAILLKLNKLLQQNRFKESLSLLNTLYYETEMDDEQEKQAIVFTDNFYDKLYKTGDSLLKKEHAAEALELFEVLEIFCQNLPTAYCNDDYYHGVLNSKTGIYDSYIAIANAAEKRDNPQIAARFYQYAQEYLDNNPYLKSYEPRPEKTSLPLVSEPPPTVYEPLPTVSEPLPTVSELLPPVSASLPPVSASLPPVSAPSPKELKEKYDNMVLQALALCIKEDFSASYKMFLEAKRLEDCRCFTTDFRVDLMIRELSEIIH